jgi:hypothetical protein
MADQTPPHPSERAAGSVTFVSFIVSLARTAAVHFGDVPDPATGRAGTANLAAAAQIIDVLALLEDKTRGNLSPEERRLLAQLVAELRLRFMSAEHAVPAPSPSAGAGRP